MANYYYKIILLYKMSPKQLLTQDGCSFPNRTDSTPELPDGPLSYAIYKDTAVTPTTYKESGKLLANPEKLFYNLSISPLAKSNQILTEEDLKYSYDIFPDLYLNGTYIGSILSISGLTYTVKSTTGKTKSYYASGIQLTSDDISIIKNEGCRNFIRNKNYKKFQISTDISNLEDGDHASTVHEFDNSNNDYIKNVVKCNLSLNSSSQIYYYLEESENNHTFAQNNPISFIPLYLKTIYKYFIKFKIDIPSSTLDKMNVGAGDSNSRITINIAYRQGESGQWHIIKTYDSVLLREYNGVYSDDYNTEFSFSPVLNISSSDKFNLYEPEYEWGIMFRIYKEWTEWVSSSSVTYRLCLYYNSSPTTQMPTWVNAEDTYFIVDHPFASSNTIDLTKGSPDGYYYSSVVDFKKHFTVMHEQI